MVDPRTQLYLTYIKAVLERAEDQLETGTPLDSILATHHAHLAVEWLLRFYSKAWGGNFPCILNKAKRKARGNDKLIRLLEYWSEHLLRLNDLRNSAQHHATVSHSDTKNAVEIAREFISQFVKICYGVDYEELTFSNLLKTKEFREIAKEAEEALRNNKYKEAIDKALDLLTLILYGNEKLDGLVGIAGTLTGTLLPLENLLKILEDTYYEGYCNKEVRKLAEDIGKAIKNLEATITLMQFLTREEKATLLDLLSPRKWKDEVKHAKALIHFIIMLAWRIETLNLVRLMQKTEM